MVSVLDQLKKFTVVVADTGDVEAIGQHQPRDATTNPSLILAAAKLAQYDHVIQGALDVAKKEAGDGADAATIATECVDQLSVAFGKEILKIVPGRVSTEVDARLSYDKAATVAKAKKLIGLYEAAGIARERILIKVASTWEGIQAAADLEKEGIHCNLTLLFSLVQAVACADARVTLISPFVGRIFDWYKKKDGVDGYPGPEDPGVISVTEIFNYYKKYGIHTEIMGASFRNTDEIVELAGCDLLTISPKLLTALSELDSTLVKKLDADAAKAKDITALNVDQAEFDKLLAANPMASEKLVEGIKGFEKAIVTLEDLIKERLA